MGDLHSLVGPPVTINGLLYPNGLVYEQGPGYRTSSLTLSNRETGFGAGINNDLFRYYGQNYGAHDWLKPQGGFLHDPVNDRLLLQYATIIQSMYTLF